jgi:hypothetical protein
MARIGTGICVYFCRPALIAGIAGGTRASACPYGAKSATGVACRSFCLSLKKLIGLLQREPGLIASLHMLCSNAVLFAPRVIEMMNHDVSAGAACLNVPLSNSQLLSAVMPPGKTEKLGSVFTDRARRGPRSVADVAGSHGAGRSGASGGSRVRVARAVDEAVLQARRGVPIS